MIKTRILLQPCRSSSDCNDPTELCDPSSGSCRQFICSGDPDCPGESARCHEGVHSKYCSGEEQKGSEAIY